MKRVKLKSGSWLIQVDKPGLYTSCIAVFAPAGAVWSPPGKEGLAHFVEHMLLRGTNTFPNSYRLMTQLEKTGAVIDAWTDKEFSAIYISAPRNKLKLAAQVLIDCLTNSLFSARDIKKEKKIISREIAMNKQKLDRQFFRRWLEGANLDPAYHISTLGTNRSIATFTRQDILQFVTERYQIPNLFFVAVGDLRQLKLDTLFNRWLKTSSKVISKSKNKSEKKRFDEDQSHHLELAALADTPLVYGFSWNSAVSYQAYLILELIESLLLRGWSAKIKQSLRAKEALTYTINHQLQVYTKCGYLSLQFPISRKSYARTVSLMDKAFNDLIEGKLSRSELLRAKRFLVHQLLIKSDDPLFSAYWYGKRHQLYPDVTESIEQTCKKFQRISIKNIKTVARQLLHIQNRYIYVADFDQA